MPSYQDSIPFSLQNAPLPDKIYPLHLLEEEDASLALQTSSADSFFPRSTDTRRRNSTQFNEAFACDDFRMYDYKVRRCMRGRSHDWTDCPFAHPGEKARRRDPRKIHYSGAPCPDFRKGSCERGDACEFAHGVFECWLHPARYRTQPCKDGKNCTRRVCFFAHSTQQLRHVAVPAEESLVEREMVDSYAHGLYSHTQDLGSPVRMSYEHEVGLPSQAKSSEECISAVILPTNSPCGTDSMVGLLSQDVYANVGSISKTLSVLTLSSQNVSGSPFEAVSTVGFPSINPMGVPLEVHSPSPDFPTVAPRPFVASSRMGALSQNDCFTVEWSSAPEIISSASSLQLHTPVVGAQSSSNSHTTSEREHSLYMGGFPSQPAAAWQNFLMHEDYSIGGRSTFSASADEVFDIVRHGGDTEMLHSYLNALGRGRPDANEVANELNGAAKSTGSTDQLALLRKEMYEFSSYNSYGSYGLSSPTSTLAGTLYPSPFSSPPLSPLSTPSSETSNVFSSRCHGNVQVDDTGPKVDVHIQNSCCVKELEFKHAFTSQRSLHSRHCSQLLGYGKVNTMLHPCLKLPSLSECTSGQNNWAPSCNNWISEDTYNCGASQLLSDDMQHKICDRFEGESPAENAMPDLRWVHELVM